MSPNDIRAGSGKHRQRDSAIDIAGRAALLRGVLK